MALQGLGIVTWFGWFSGVILLRRPWGCPSFDSWLSISSALVPTNIITCSVLLTDAYLHFKEELLLPFTFGGDLLYSLIIKASFVEIIITNLLIYMVFIVQAKNLAKVWGKLYRRNFDDAKHCKCTYLIGNWLNTIFAFVSFVGLLSLAILDGVPIGKNSWKSWFNFLGFECYSFVVLRFMVGPFIIPLNCAFSVVLTTLHQLQKIYERYCQKVHEIILNAESPGKKTETNLTSASATSLKITNRWKIPPDLKRKVVEEFEEVQELFGLSEHAISPLVLIILTGGTLRLVISAAKILLRDSANFWDLIILKDVAHLVIVGCHLSLLRTGQSMLDSMNEWKRKMRQASFQLDSLYSIEAKDLKDLSLLVNNWNWKLSASGYFDVNINLARGIISLLMAYTVILVQIRISFEGG